MVGNDHVLSQSEQAPQTFDYNGASEFTGLPVGTLHWMVHRKTIPHLRFGPRHVRFEVEALREWITTKRVLEERDQVKGSGGKRR